MLYAREEISNSIQLDPKSKKDIWQNQYNIVKLKNKIKKNRLKKKGIPNFTKQSIKQKKDLVLQQRFLLLREPCSLNLKLNVYSVYVFSYDSLS